ncbi:hypothetical protein [Candidatus Pseudoscillospira sp. SGI.172]|uniref:hypothetical protein n=1 Tax=Candidatus Pseudoscillospira sp. SGI.172 TaxID=3420582 RepID=UPI0018E92CE9
MRRAQIREKIAFFNTGAEKEKSFLKNDLNVTIENYTNNNIGQSKAHFAAGAAA